MSYAEGTCTHTADVTCIILLTCTLPDICKEADCPWWIKAYLFCSRYPSHFGPGACPN